MGNFVRKIGEFKLKKEDIMKNLKLKSYTYIPVLIIGLLISFSYSQMDTSYIRIGDADGFGFDEGLVAYPTSGYSIGDAFKSVNNAGTANVDGANMLADGDMVPILKKNADPSLMILACNNNNCTNNFDLRSADEMADSVTLNDTKGVMALGSATEGSIYTDLSYSWKFDRMSLPLYGPRAGLSTRAERKAIYPTGRDPDDSLWRSMGDIKFVFDFTVCGKCVKPSVTKIIDFSLVLADFNAGGIKDGRVYIHDDAGNDVEVKDGANWWKLKNINSNGIDKISLPVNLTFDQIFNKSGSVWNGYIRVEAFLESEPYFSIDYAELRWENPVGELYTTNVIKVK